MQEIELAIIINSYNRIGLLKESIGSLVKEMQKTALPFGIIVFEAGSTDGSIEWLERFSSESPVFIRVIKASEQEDTSFSHGVNSACLLAIEKFKSIKYLLLYETDNYIKSGLPIVQAIEVLEENLDVGACGFTVQKHSGKEAGIGCPFPTLVSFALGKQFSHFLKLDKPRLNWMRKNSNELSYCQVVYTSPLLIKKDSWQALEGFDSKRFPFSDCDIDLAHRIRGLGMKMIVLKTADVIHDNLQTPSSWSDTRTIREYRARFVYFRKHHGKIVHLVKPFLWLSHFLELILLISLVVLGKRKFQSIRTRFVLLKKVFFNYR